MAKEGDGFGQDMDMADKATRVQAARVDVSFSDDDVQALSDVATACGSSSSEAEAELAEFMGFVDRGSIS
ncbi:hypothetical protein PVAP13_8KG060968 [Panicum virgatum]|uniref:Uncharacterized protein n=1 Tax=Panicum virgatum TaxID=38727 RepID=A0A8T0PHK5_PANVG|nr:hypothetical protein PVAP13_8KG060968 [Panicum virgatum]